MVPGTINGAINGDQGTVLWYPLSVQVGTREPSPGPPLNYLVMTFFTALHAE